MKGYVYLDYDDRLHLRTWEYINGVDPGFFVNNKAFVQKYWIFDTEDWKTFQSLLRTFGKDDLKLPDSEVVGFLRSVGLSPPDLKVLKENADKVQPR